jgi:1-acyl-sn-glycerol-3-phosphate acyltransferase
MARMAKVPVQPMAVVGARDIFRSGKKLPRLFWRVFLKVGDCLGFEDMKSEGRREKTEEMERVGMERVYALRDALRKEHPGKN